MQMIQEAVGNTESFPCTLCGACCRSIHAVKELEMFCQNGICVHLQGNNSCAIYENRPIVCNIEELYQHSFANIMSKKDFYNANIKICNDLQEKFGIDKKYRIKEM